MAGGDGAWKRRGTWAAAILAGIVGSGQVHGATVLSDGFGDGDRDNDGTLDGPVENAADVGAAFYTARSNTLITATIASDATVAGAPVEIGSGNALNVGVGTTTNRPLVANFNSVTLADGESISFAFNIRVTESPITALDRKFRFGLYNSNGTLVTDNASAAATTDDDTGYFAEIDSGADVAGSTVDVRGDNIPGTGNSFLGGTGTDSVSLAATDPAFSLDDNDSHLLKLTLQRSGAQLNLSLSFDGVVTDTGFTGGANPAALTFTYNEITIGTNIGGTVEPFDYRIDNVVVDYATVPEPTTLSVLAAAGAVGLRRRRRTRI